MAIPVFGQVHALSFLVPTSVGIANYVRLNKAMRIFVVLCFLACLDVAIQLYLSMRYVKNYFISDYFRVIETSFFCAVFYYSVVSGRVRAILRVLGILFAVVWVVDMTWFNNPDHMNSGMSMISRAFVLGMSLLTLQTTMKDTRLHLVERPVFWIAVGAIIYSTGTLLVVGLSNQLLQLGPTYFVVAWHVNWSLLIIANLFYTKGMMCKSEA